MADISTLTKIAAKTAAGVAAAAQLSEAAAPPADDLSPGAFLGRLVDAGLKVDALKFLAHALPKREAVWWGARCTRLACGESLSPVEQAALEAAERWCADPTDERRRAAMQAAEAAKFDRPAGCVALAAFFSGGSLAPPELPAVAPADDLTPRTVAGAILMAAVQSRPEKAGEKYQRFFEQGVAIASGRDSWK